MAHNLLTALSVAASSATVALAAIGRPAAIESPTELNRADAAATAALSGETGANAIADGIAEDAWATYRRLGPADGGTVRVAVFPALRTAANGKAQSCLFSEDIVAAIERKAPSDVECLVGAALVAELEEMYYSAREYNEPAVAELLATTIQTDFAIAGVFNDGVNESGHPQLSAQMHLFRTADGKHSTTSEHPVTGKLKRRVSGRGSEANVAFGDDDRAREVAWDDKAADELVARQLELVVRDFLEKIGPLPPGGDDAPSIGVMPVWREDTETYSAFSERVDAAIGDQMSGTQHAKWIDRKLHTLQQPRTVSWYSLDPLESKYRKALGLHAIIQATYRYVEGGRIRVELDWQPYFEGGKRARHKAFFLDKRIDEHVAALMAKEPSDAYEFEPAAVDLQLELQLGLEEAIREIAATVSSKLEKGERIYVLPALTPATEPTRVLLDQFWAELDDQLAEVTEWANENGVPIEEAKKSRPVHVAGRRFNSISEATTKVMQKMESNLVLMGSGRTEARLGSHLTRFMRTERLFGESVLQPSEGSMRQRGVGRRSTRNKGNFKADAPKAFKLTDSRYWVMPAIELVGDKNMQLVVEIIDTQSYGDIPGGLVTKMVPRAISDQARKSFEKLDTSMPSEFLQIFEDGVRESAAIEASAEAEAEAEAAEPKDDFKVSRFHLIHWTPGSVGKSITQAMRGSADLSMLGQSIRDPEEDPVAAGLIMKSECELIYDATRPGAKKAAERIYKVLTGDPRQVLGTDAHELIDDLEPLVRRVTDYPAEIQVKLLHDLKAGGGKASVLLVIAS